MSRNHDYRIICITLSNASIEVQAPHHVGPQYNRDEGRFRTGRIPASHRGQTRQRESFEKITFFSHSHLHQMQIQQSFFFAHFESNFSSKWCERVLKEKKKRKEIRSFNEETKVETVGEGRKKKWFSIVFLKLSEGIISLALSPTGIRKWMNACTRGMQSFQWFITVSPGLTRFSWQFSIDLFHPEARYNTRLSSV